MNEIFRPIPTQETKKPEIRPGDKVILEIDGENVECTYCVFSAEYFDPNLNPDIKYLIKTKPIKAVIAKGGEEIITKQDGLAPRIAKAGQVIIQNNPDSENPESPYIFGNGEHSPEEQAVEFEKNYIAVPNRPGYYFKIPEPIAATMVDQATAIRPSWDPNGFMGTPAGGVVTEGGYTISPRSLFDSYKFVDQPSADKVYPFSFSREPLWRRKLGK